MKGCRGGFLCSVLTGFQDDVTISDKPVLATVLFSPLYLVTGVQDPTCPLLFALTYSFSPKQRLPLLWLSLVLGSRKKFLKLSKNSVFIRRKGRHLRLFVPALPCYSGCILGLRGRQFLNQVLDHETQIPHEGGPYKVSALLPTPPRQQML
jgi:hypothetical protein